VLVAAAVMAWTALVDWKHWRTDGQLPSRTLRLGIGVLPVVVGIGWLNAHLYGSPLESGYGSLDYIYSLDHVWANMNRFTKWMVESQTPIVFAGALFFLLPSMFSNQRIDFPPEPTPRAEHAILVGSHVSTGRSRHGRTFDSCRRCGP
jgi:hypothetical protein